MIWPSDRLPLIDPPMATRRNDPRVPLCRAFSDPLRVRVLNLLKHKGELCKHDIAQFFEINRGEITRQLNLLERADLVRSRLEGHFRFYRLSESVSPFHQKLLESLSCFEELAELADDIRRQASWTPQGLDGPLDCSSTTS